MRLLREYTVCLDTDARTLVLQFPLLRSRPVIRQVRSKSGNAYMEVDVESRTRLMNAERAREMGVGEVQKTVGLYAPLRNDYYVLRVGEDGAQGEKVDKIVQFRHTLDYLDKGGDKEKEKDRKEEKTLHVRRTETKEELEMKSRNPNYLHRRLEREAFVKYEIKEGGAGELSSGTSTQVVPGATERIGEGHPLSEDIAGLRRTIYNARVSNMSTLSRLYGAVPKEIVRKVLREMTVEFHGRYILKKEYFGDLAGTLEEILRRCKTSEQGAYFVMTSREMEERGDDLVYLLGELCIRDGQRYYLKGGE